MEVNGRNSCTGNSRHVDIRFFFVYDRMKSGDIKVVYCPTDKMVADFFTKPLQGGIFKKFRDSVMGYNCHDLTFIDGRENDPTKSEAPQCHTSKEHVGNLVPDQ